MNIQRLSEITYRLQLKFEEIIDKFNDDYSESEICYPLLEEEDYRKLCKIYSDKVPERVFYNLVRQDCKNIEELANTLSVFISENLHDNDSLKREIAHFKKVFDED